MNTLTSLDTGSSFLSKLRERSSIVFTIGLALSIASFVENLHMGKDAIAFVVEKLSQIDGWADAVKAVAAIFHGALEWWRGVLRDLLSFLPFHVPQWLHDPLSVTTLGIAHLRMRSTKSFEQAQHPDSLSSAIYRRTGISVFVLWLIFLESAIQESVWIVLALAAILICDVWLFGSSMLNETLISITAISTSWAVLGTIAWRLIRAWRYRRIFERVSHQAVDAD